METDVKSNKVAIIREAKSLLEKCGWIQGKYGSKDIGFCAIGAIRSARNELFSHKTEPDGTCLGCVMEQNDNDVIREISVPLDWDLAEWNDKRGRTKEEVIAKFDEYIVSLTV